MLTAHADPPLRAVHGPWTNAYIIREPSIGPGAHARGGVLPNALGDDVILEFPRSRAASYASAKGVVTPGGTEIPYAWKVIASAA